MEEKIVESKKKNLRIFITYLFILIYVLVTTASVTDQQLILDDLVVLPLINVKVGTKLFFLISPFFLILLFVLYQLHYLHIRNNNSELNNYPHWPLFEFPMQKILGDESNFLKKIQNILTALIIWGTLPLTLIVVLFRNLETHEIWIITYLTILAFIGTGFSFVFWKKFHEISNEKLWKVLFTTIIWNAFLFFCFVFVISDLLYTKFLTDIDKDIKLFTVFVLFLYFSPIICSILQKLLLKFSFFYQHSLNFWFTILIIPFISIHYLVSIPSGSGRNVDLSYKIITSYTNQTFNGVYSVDLRSKNLISANLISSVLVKADMRRADLREAALYSARLDSANLEKANLKGANLYKAILRYSNLESANFINTDLRSANLGGANLSYADFTNSNLQGANLNLTILDSTNFRGANLYGVKLLPEQLINLKSLYETKLDSSVLEDVENLFPFLLNKK